MAAVSALNKAHFDSIANQYDASDLAIERAEKSAVAIRKLYAFDENTTAVMEFACGTGFVSRALSPYCKRNVGVDISQGMVNQFNKRIGYQGLTSAEMQAVCAELKGEPGELGDEKFDVIVCASAYHHFASIDDVTRMLTHFLKSGGALLVVDLLKTDDGQGHFHHVAPDDVDYVAHKGGLGEVDMRRAFESAGLSSFDFNAKALRVRHHGHDTHLFTAKGIKPGGEVA